MRESTYHSMGNLGSERARIDNHIILRSNLDVVYEIGDVNLLRFGVLVDLQTGPFVLRQVEEIDFLRIERVGDAGEWAAHVGLFDKVTIRKKSGCQDEAVCRMETKG